jgi:hypothetical protein
MAELTFHYGLFTHPDCEVYPKSMTFQKRRSKDGKVYANAVQLHVAGDLIGANTKAEIDARIGELDGVYAVDGHDVGFKLEGNWTQHRLLNNDAANLTGNRVIYRSWDNTLPTEFANTRSFSIGFEAVFNDGDQNIIEFDESVIRVGTGGPLWKIYPKWNGDPIKVEIADKTPVTHVQRGYVLSRGQHLAPPPPLWPLEHQGWRRVVRQDQPTNWGFVRANSNPSPKFSLYRTSWEYYFERLGPDPTTPFNTGYVS